MTRFRALVTGGGGFVGAHLVSTLLAEGHEVHATLRPGGSRWRRPALSGSEIHEVDLLDFDRVRGLLLEIRPEVIFHAAFVSAYADLPTRRLLAEGPRILANLLDALEDSHDVDRFVHLGSSMEYGPSDRPHREDDLLQPRSSRGVVKAAESHLALQRARLGRIPTVVLRIFSVYGPWEHPHRLVPTAIRAALEDEELPLTAPGFGRDYVYAADVARACMIAAASPRAVGEIFNVGTGRQVNNEEMVDEIERVVGRPIRRHVGAYEPHATDKKTWVADISKARRALGWRPLHGLAEGLRETVEWIRCRPAPRSA